MEVSYVQIDTAKLVNNIRTIRAHIPPSVQLMAVVKNDAYGNGALKTAELALAHGFSLLGVARVGEALYLRQNGKRDYGAHHDTGPCTGRGVGRSDTGRIPGSPGYPKRCGSLRCSCRKAGEESPCYGSGGYRTPSYWDFGRRNGSTGFQNPLTALFKTLWALYPFHRS